MGKEGKNKRSTKAKRGVVFIDGKVKILDTDSPEYKSYMKEAYWEDRWDEIEKHNKRIQRRVRSSYKPGKTNLIFYVENVWIGFEGEDFDLEVFDPVFKCLKKCVEFWSNYYARRWSRFRLSVEDFESIFWEECWRLAKTYAPESDFYFWEHINKKLEMRGKDIVRQSTQGKQQCFERTAVSLEQYLEKDRTGRGESMLVAPIDIEKKVTDKIFVEQIINDQSLTDEEQKLLKLYYENPGASFKELADKLNYSHREQARRTFERAKKKLLVKYAGEKRQDKQNTHQDQDRPGSRRFYNL